MLLLSVVLCLVACQKNEQNPSFDGTQTTTTTETTTEEDTEPTLSPSVAQATIIGSWIYDETITPQNFYGEHYNSEITKTNVKMRTTYTFKKDGSFSTGVSIVNMNAVEKEYKSLMVYGAQKEAESQGKYLSTKNVEYFENYAKKVLKDICKTEKGTYSISGKTITYQMGENISTETFKLDENKLTVKGVKDNEYSMTLTRQ